VRPTVEHMAAEGAPVTGTLYAGCILTEGGPELLEYNCRFGDPETQVVLPRLLSSLAEVLQATAEGRLAEADVRWSPERCVCVVLSAGGYPGDYQQGQSITGLEPAEAPGTLVFHAGTAQREGQLVTAGGRVLNVSAVGATFAEARRAAYAAAERLHFSDCYYRQDIALRAELWEQQQAPQQGRPGHD